MVLGARAPRFRLRAEYDYTYGPDAQRFLESVGLHLDPWQLDVLTDYLGESGDRWAHRSATLIVPRQNGKSFLLAARILVGLFLVPREKTILYSAHNSKPMREVFEIVKDVVESSPALSRRAQVRTANGQESVTVYANTTAKRRRVSARVHFVARTNNMNNSSRGFSPQLIILDEAMFLTDDTWSSIRPAMSAQSSRQVIMASSAGIGISTVLKRRRDGGRNGSAVATAYDEWTAEGSGLDRMDEASWALANPSYGYRLTREAIEEELPPELSPDAFDRERLGIWSTGAIDTALSIDGYASIGVGSLPLPTKGTVSVDVHQIPGGERSAAVALSWLEDGMPHSVVLRQEPGVRWLPEQVAATCAQYGATEVFMSIGGARDVAELIEGEGVKVRGLALAEWKSACTGLGQMITDNACRVQVTPLLSRAVAAAEARSWPDQGWTFDGRKTSGVPIPGLVAWAVGSWAVKSTAAADYDVLASVY